MQSWAYFVTGVLLLFLPTPGDVTLRYLQWWCPTVLPDELKMNISTLVHEL